MRDRIRALLRSHGRLPIDVDDLDDRENLFKAGLKSFAAVQLLLALEDEFGIMFDLELGGKLCESVDAIAKAVNSGQAMAT